MKQSIDPTQVDWRSADSLSSQPSPGASNVLPANSGASTRATQASPTACPPVVNAANSSFPLISPPSSETNRPVSSAHIPATGPASRRGKNASVKDSTSAVSLATVQSFAPFYPPGSGRPQAQSRNSKNHERKNGDLHGLSPVTGTNNTGSNASATLRSSRSPPQAQQQQLGPLPSPQQSLADSIVCRTTNKSPHSANDSFSVSTPRSIQSVSNFSGGDHIQTTPDSAIATLEGLRPSDNARNDHRPQQKIHHPKNNSTQHHHRNSTHSLHPSGSSLDSRFQGVSGGHSSRMVDSPLNASVSFRHLDAESTSPTSPGPTGRFEPCSPTSLSQHHQPFPQGSMVPALPPSLTPAHHQQCHTHHQQQGPVLGLDPAHGAEGCRSPIILPHHPPSPSSSHIGLCSPQMSYHPQQSPYPGGSAGSMPLANGGDPALTYQHNLDNSSRHTNHRGSVPSHNPLSIAGMSAPRGANPVPTSASLPSGSNVIQCKFLPPDITEEQFLGLFSRYGLIVFHKLHPNTSSKNPQAAPASFCVGLVHYRDPAAALLAIEHTDRVTYGGKVLKVTLYDPTRPSPPPPPTTETAKPNIYVANLPHHWTRRELIAHFTGQGSDGRGLIRRKVVSGRILSDQHGVSRHIGFVEFESTEAAANAIQENEGLPLAPGSEPCVVRFARDEPKARTGTRGVTHTLTSHTILPNSSQTMSHGNHHQGSGHVLADHSAYASSSIISHNPNPPFGSLTQHQPSPPVALSTINGLNTRPALMHQFSSPVDMANQQAQQQPYMGSMYAHSVAPSVSPSVVYSAAPTSSMHQRPNFGPQPTQYGGNDSFGSAGGGHIASSPHPLTNHLSANSSSQSQFSHVSNPSPPGHNNQLDIGTQNTQSPAAGYAPLQTSNSNPNFGMSELITNMSQVSLQPQSMVGHNSHQRGGYFSPQSPGQGQGTFAPSPIPSQQGFSSQQSFQPLAVQHHNQQFSPSQSPPHGLAAYNPQSPFPLPPQSQQQSQGQGQGQGQAQYSPLSSNTGIHVSFPPRMPNNSGSGPSLGGPQGGPFNGQNNLHMAR